LKLEYYITRKLLKDKSKSTFSKNAVNIAVFSVALGITVMILSLAVVTGFKKEIAEKVVGFGAHIQVGYFDSQLSYENRFIERDSVLFKNLKKNIGINHLQVFAIKPGIIKTDIQLQGIVAKGIDTDFNWRFFEDKIVEGRILEVTDSTRSTDILISKSLARLLNLKVEEKIQVWFIQEPPRVRVFDICGIYETGLEEFDLMYVFIDIKHIQRLNNWTEDQVSGFEIFINNFSQLNEIDDYVYNEIGFTLNSKTIKELYPAIFDWLDLLDMNAIVILIIMLVVAVINMITTLLIIILERTNMIGIIKTIGATNSSIRKIFLLYAFFILIKGLIWGNVISLVLCFLQIHFGLITLPQESYFVSSVPININFLHILLVNLGTIFCTLIILIGPSYITTKIAPAKAIKFD